ncbi:MAG: hypothetical protein P8J78_11895 [Maricaulis sp.]|jgi:hypothetical protein|nr:hypothetical protein [Maricaulis sp.]MDG2045301.1 hypothetical protein [Maricaulis sp.]
MPDSNSALFVHFGLGKCASTFIQNVWTLDPQYTCLNLTQMAESIHTLIAAGKAGSIPPFRTNITAQPGTTMVASSEALTWAFVRTPSMQHLIPQVQKEAIRIIGESSLSRKALIFVRNPLDWIRACHEQSLKEGLSQNGEAFSKTNAVLIESVLDLKRIKSLLEAHFDEVIFLSTDQLRSEPDQFWKTYSTALDAPTPSDTAINTITNNDALKNPSLGRRRTQLGLINRQLNLLEEAWSGLEGLPGFAEVERRAFLNHYKTSTRWAARRVAEFGTDDILNEICGVVTTQIEDEFAVIPISDRLRAHLLENFYEPLLGTPHIPQDVLDSYKDHICSVKQIAT